MAGEFKVRRARLLDASAIAQFVNDAQAGRPSAPKVTRSGVAERFGQIGFMVAECTGDLVGLLGWQIENLIVRVTDYLIASPVVDPVVVGRAMVNRMEDEATELQAEVVLLFLPAGPSPRLLAFWEGLGYRFVRVDDLPKASREAVVEGGLGTEKVMSKSLREGAGQRPI